jgi:hypothetical protein
MRETGKEKQKERKKQRKNERKKERKETTKQRNKKERKKKERKKGKKKTNKETKQERNERNERKKGNETKKKEGKKVDLGHTGTTAGSNANRSQRDRKYLPIGRREEGGNKDDAIAQRLQKHFKRQEPQDDRPVRHCQSCATTVLFPKLWNNC